ncbi:CHASE domain-containing protein [Aurantiacibacter suaedae]|uniref:CHASE domain-containing protein n=1 Tax=Aurantiacibacter suaedae TaxID=2545755 RepID=UPI0010F93ED7|nr:CHASE domain-containing protein [Aurantiacibacter suaedae]
MTALVSEHSAKLAFLRPKTPTLLWLRDVVLLAIGYFVAGYVGLALAIPPGYATIIWPASGIALCALLLRDRTIWPGIWLGSFGINLFNSGDGVSSAQSLLPVAMVAAAIAGGACIQALIGHTAVRRFGPVLELSSPRQFVRFLVLAILLPCLVSSAVGVAALAVANLVTIETLAGNWLIWLTGDLLGVGFILPVLIFSSHSPLPVRWRGRRLPNASSGIALSIAAMLLLTGYSWKHMAEREYELSSVAFAALATDTERALSNRIAVYERALDASAAFAANSDSISPAKWGNYVERLGLEDHYPGMRGIGFFRLVLEDEMPAFREQFAHEYGDRFSIHPEIEREEHFIINRIEPLNGNLAALGLDLAFEEGRRAAIARSLRNGAATMTRPIVLVQDAKQGVGFLFMKPVGDESSPQRGQWIVAPLVAEEFLGDLTPREGQDFSLEVYFGAELAPENLMFATSLQQNRTPRFEDVRRIEMANQIVTLRWRSLPAFDKRVSNQGDTLVLIGGIIISALLGLVLIAFTRREGMVLRKVEEATAELERHNAMLELAEATAHVGHWQFDTISQTIYWSDEVYRIHGRAVGKPIGLEEAITYYHPDDRKIVTSSLEEAMVTKSAYRFSARLIREDRVLRHVEVIGQVQSNEEGEVSSILGVIIDRTDEITMRDSLTKARDEAQAADTAKSNFLANMSHEIRTPMNGVIGFTELALSEEKDPAQRRRLQMISDSSAAMLRLLNDLLDFAKIEANQMAIVEEATNLRRLLRGVVRLMEPIADAKGLILSLEIDMRLPQYVLIDKMRLRQVVLNLVGNAIKFTEKGMVKVVVSLVEPAQGSPARLSLAVRDTGVGIPANRLASIFDKFTQADDTIARKYGGTGLGLPISAQLVDLMGGTIRVESELGEGSRFVVSLPLQETDLPDEAAVTDAPQPSAGDPVALRILIAEDNPVNQEVTMAMVEKVGHVCDLARNGREAVDMVMRAKRNGSPFDMVLMDMQMPLLDGLGAATMIREAGISPEELPIIAVTANAYADDIHRCHEAGMQAHVAKPLRLAQLNRVLAGWSKRGAEPDLSPATELEQETDPRLNRMFDERVSGALEAIDAVIARNDMTEEERTEIASLLHQIAGVAGYFGRSELGEKCRDVERCLLADPAHSAGLDLLAEIREEIARQS